jgi:acyl phosphate:glycerol-3-phosphate acyltransferase
LTFVAFAAAYLIGGLPFSVWVVRWRLPGADLRRLGSGNPGATNALRVGGKAVGLWVLAFDVSKGFAAVELARALGVEPRLLGAAALAAVVGHIASIWLGFRGGKGVATAAGGLVSLAPPAIVAASSIFVLVVLATRIVALGSVAAAVTLPIAEWLAVGIQEPAARAMVLWVLLISLLVLARHGANLRRMLDGREERLGKHLETS